MARATRSGAGQHDRSAALFTEVSSAVGQAAMRRGIFEVVLVDGTTVRIGEDFDPDSLRILLETLRSC
jgi:hypothetical protein